MNVPFNEKREAASRKRLRCDLAGYNEVHNSDGGDNNYKKHQEIHLSSLIHSKTMRKMQDLPMEMLQLILVHVVVEELKDAKLAKVAWNDEVKQIIGRLKKVGYVWNRILETSHFHSEVERKLQNLAVVSLSLHRVMEMKFTFQVDACNIVFIGDRLFIYHEWARCCQERFKTIYQYQLSIFRVSNGRFEIEGEKKYQVHWYPVGITACSIKSSDDCLLVGGIDKVIYKINLTDYELSSLQQYDDLRQLAGTNCRKILVLQSTERKSEFVMNTHSSDFTWLHSVRIMCYIPFDGTSIFNLNHRGNIIFAHRLSNIWGCSDYICAFEVNKNGEINSEKTVLVTSNCFEYGVGLNSNSHLLVIKAREPDLQQKLKVYDSRLNKLGIIPTNLKCFGVVCGKDNSFILIGQDLIEFYRLNYE